MQVFLVQDGEEFRVPRDIAKVEGHQLCHGLGGGEVGHLHLALLGALGGIGGLQHLQPQRLLAAEMGVEHALIGAGPGGDFIHPRACQALFGEFHEGGIKDARPGGGGAGGEGSCGALMLGGMPGLMPSGCPRPGRAGR